jgi:hypothetical protein
MNTKIGVILVLVALGLLCIIGPVAADNSSIPGMQYANDIQPFTGPIGPDSSLYGLKLAFENLDDAFTFNQSERLDQEIDHSDTRLGELESALAANKTDAADRALNQYWQDMNQTEQTLSWFNASGSLAMPNGTYNGTVALPGFDENYTRTGYSDRFNNTGFTPGPADAALVAAQQRILLHQEFLDNLIASHPDNPGLARAYNASQDLEQRFEQKTQLHFDLLRDAENRPVFHPVPLSAIAQNRIPPVYSWNQTRDNTANSGNGQYTGQVTPAWQDQHRQDTQVNYSHSQFPANNQGYRNGNDNGNNSSYAYNNHYTNGNDNRDSRFSYP